MIQGSATARGAAVGDTFSTGLRDSGFHEWNRYAAVNDEFVPIHMDDEEGRRAGFPSAIGMGRLQWSYLHNLLRDFLDGEGRIASVQLQYRSPNLKGMEFDTKGKVVEIREADGERLLDLEVWIEDGEGKVMAPGTATVALPL